jgi:purine-binding chemotaxis protein CheW
VRALLLPVGPDWYAVAISAVREVMARPPVTPVPNGPRELLGLFNLRGEILPLLDTATLLALGSLPHPAYTAVVSCQAGSAGLTVSAMPEAAELDQPVAGDVVAGMTAFAVGSRLVALIDVDDLLGGSRHR